MTMDHAKIEAENVAERYVMGSLPADEVEHFEAHFLDCDECLERLEETRLLVHGLRGVAAEELQQTQAVGLGLLAWLARRSRGLQSVVLMAVALAVLAPWILRSGGGLDAAAPYLVTPALVLGQTRSAAEEVEPDARLTLPDDASAWVSLALFAPPDVPDGSVRLRLLDADGTTVWNSAPTPVRGGERVQIQVPAARLQLGLHVVELVPAAAGGAEVSEALRFPFLVEAP